MEECIPNKRGLIVTNRYGDRIGNVYGRNNLVNYYEPKGICKKFV